MKDMWKIALGLVCGLLGGGLILLLSSQPRGEPIALLPPPTPAPITIHIVGAVANPGVYTLPAGSRVQEAIRAAGGVLPEANSQALNQAAMLQDGERVLVPVLATPALRFAYPVPFEDPAQPQFPININTATQAELEKLPDIGPVTAQKIIEYRQANGPFTAIEGIMEVPGIGPKTFESIKSLITVEP
jgi:competence protein ComEA